MKVTTGWVAPPLAIGGLDHLVTQAPCVKIIMSSRCHKGGASRLCLYVNANLQGRKPMQAQRQRLPGSALMQVLLFRFR
jgi:hypothetical protein